MAEPKKDDIFSDDNAVKSAWISWGKPGDKIQGTLIGKAARENTINGKTEMQTVYEIKAKSGDFHKLKQDENGNYVPESAPTPINEGEIWNIGGRAGIDAQLRNVKIGQIVGLKFMESLPAKKAGNSPTKVIKVFTEGKMDEQWLEEKENEGVGDGF